MIGADRFGRRYTRVRFTRRRLAYSGGGLAETIAAAIDRISPEAWTPAYDAEGVERDGAWVAELTGCRLVGLARGDACDRPEGTPASGCAVAVH